MGEREREREREIGRGRGRESEGEGVYSISCKLANNLRLEKKWISAIPQFVHLLPSAKC